MFSIDGPMMYVWFNACRDYLDLIHVHSIIKDISKVHYRLNSRKNHNSKWLTLKKTLKNKYDTKCTYHNIFSAYIPSHHGIEHGWQEHWMRQRQLQEPWNANARDKDEDLHHIPSKICQFYHLHTIKSFHKTKQ